MSLDIVKSPLSALGFYNLVRGFKGAYIRGAYIQGGL